MLFARFPRVRETLAACKTLAIFIDRRRASRHHATAISTEPHAHALLHLNHVRPYANAELFTARHKALSQRSSQGPAWIFAPPLAMASLVDAPSMMTVDPAEPARGGKPATPPSKSQKKREQRRRAAERKRAADAAAAPEPAPEPTPRTEPDATTPPQLSPEQIAAMVSAAKKNMAEVDPNASPEDKVKAAMQALQLVTGVLQSRGGDDEVMRQLQAAKARAATERKLKEKLKGMKESR